MPAANAFETMQAPSLPRHRPRAPREISLLGPRVRALAAGRDRCCHCHRTPLVGEDVHHYGEWLVCQLCRHLRREAPGRTEMMHSPEHARAVKVQPRAA
jgi:hypothetical protein